MSARMFCLFLGVSGALLAADKPSREILELQRDVAHLQELVQTAQQALDQKIGAVGAQAQAVAASVEKLNTTVAGLQKGLEQLSQDQQQKIVPLVAGQGSRVDQVGATLSTMQQAFGDLTASINRLQIQMTDLTNAVKVAATPAPKPPSSEDLLKGAESDRLAGKYELAAQGYAEFLRSFGDSPRADSAQFGLGMSHYQLKDMEAAVKDFDALAQNYPKSARVPEALFYQARSLQSLDRGSDVAAVCQELRRRFPRSEFARQCGGPRP